MKLEGPEVKRAIGAFEDDLARREAGENGERNGRLLADCSLRAEVRLYYDLLLPPGSADPCPLLVALHGYGGNKKQMLREASKAVPQGFAIAALQALHQHIREPRAPGEPLRYGFGWLTNFRPAESIALHHDALFALIERAVAEGVADGKKIFLLGFSQSVALIYRFIFKHADLVRGAVCICGGLPGDWETNEEYRPSRTAILHLCGTHDEFYPPERVRDYAAKLSMRASRVEVRSYDAAHEITDEMRDDVRSWLANMASL
ncbi:MAG: hypothetical protein C4334_13560 [Pyrinomonas sp.]|uniref:alpha/beta hydrolase n=1 Tax=Pyrinomonas sp. TaxID=2080306 RepID=UPI00331AB790